MRKNHHSAAFIAIDLPCSKTEDSSATLWMTFFITVMSTGDLIKLWMLNSKLWILIFWPSWNLPAPLLFLPSFLVSQFWAKEGVLGSVFRIMFVFWQNVKTNFRDRIREFSFRGTSKIQLLSLNKLMLTPKIKLFFILL